MADDTVSVWRDFLLKLPVEWQRERNALLSLLYATDRPPPPEKWSRGWWRLQYRRRTWRSRAWLGRYVTFRFARHNPADDVEEPW